MAMHNTRRLGAVAVTLVVGVCTAIGQSEGSLEESFIVEDTTSSSVQVDAADESESSDGGAIEEVAGPREVPGAQQTAGPDEVQGPQEVSGPTGTADPGDQSTDQQVQPPPPRPPVSRPVQASQPAPATDAGTIEVVEEQDEPKPVVLPLPPEKETKLRTGRSSRTDYAGISIGLRLAYFAYNELFPMEETLEFLGVDRIQGQPKSSEFGLCEGLELDLMGRIPGSPMFIRPRLSGFLGIMHRYDGSTQADVQVIGGDTVAVYEPAEMRKNNYFLRGSLELGGGHFGKKGAITVFTGIDARLWSRTFSRQEKEYYYWCNLPLGLAMHANNNKGWRFGLEMRAFFMIGGAMHYVYDQPGLFSTSPIEAPPVYLSNEIPFARRFSWRVELPIQKRLGNALSLRFYPYFEYYHFGRSNIDTMTIDPDYLYSYEPGSNLVPFYEPASDTYIGGLSLDLMLHFRRRSYR